MKFVVQNEKNTLKVFKTLKVFFFLPQILCSVGIQPYEDEEQNGKRPKRGATVAEKGQGNPDYRGQSDGHRDVDHNVEKEDAGNPVSINSAERRSLSLRQID